MWRPWRRISARTLTLAVAAAATFQAPSFAQHPAAGAAALPAPTVAPADGQDVEKLLQRLTELSEQVSRDPQSPGTWRVELEQAGVLERLAVRSEGTERDNWLRMVADAYHAAAVCSPAGETEAKQRLAQLAGRITARFPGSPAAAYAALQAVRADYLRRLTEAPGDPEAASTGLCEGLVAFAAAYPRSPEAPGALLEAAQSYEAMGCPADARRCYRYLAGGFRGQPAARKASGALWRLAGPGTPVPLDLPPLFPNGDVRGAVPVSYHPGGKVVVAYFWSSKAPQAAADFQTLRALSDRYHDKGLEVVCVNLDDDPAKGRAFLAGMLTAGEHLHLAGGPDGAEEHYGVTVLPSALLIAGDGTLARHSLKVSQLEAEVAKRLPGGR